MSAIVEQKKYVLTDAGNNNNKFWEYTWYDNGQCVVKFGRVGAAGSTSNHNFSRSQLDSKVREKTKKGYREVSIVAGPTLTKQTATSIAIQEAAMTQLANNDSTLTKVINHLVAMNKHELHVMSGGQLNVNLETGLVTTPLGVVTKDNIVKARDLLNKITPYIGDLNKMQGSDFMALINQYLMLVPQKVGASRGWHLKFITNDTDLQKQASMLDQLESSVDLAAARAKQAIEEKAGETPKLFNATIKACVDPDVIAEITAFFKKTLSNNHTSRNLKPVRVYEVEHKDMNEAFEKDGAKMKNIMRLWHGTRAFNILSIMKNGMIIPKSGGSINITGRMFGDGLYFSDISTKSLNYAQGYWDNGRKDNNCFMFLCDVAMGNYHVPSGSNSQLHRAGHDSVWAKPGRSGIINNEMIVFRTSQVAIRYLVEFSE